MRQGAGSAALLSGSATVTAVMWMGGTLLSFAAMMLAARELTSGISVFEILAFRSGIALLVLLPFVLRVGLAEAGTQRPGLHLVRNVVHFSAQFGWVYGIAHLPLAEVTALEFTTPLWTALLAVLFLGESFTRHRAVAVLIGFAGVLIILRPGMAVVELASLAVIGCAICYALSNVMVKVLTRTESALVIVFYMQIMQLPLGLVPALFDWVTPGWSDVPFLVIVAVTGLTAHYCMARALTLGDATIVIPMDFLRLPLMAFLGYLVYAETLEAWIALGALMIVAGNYYSVRRERSLERRSRES